MWQIQKIYAILEHQVIIRCRQYKTELQASSEDKQDFQTWISTSRQTNNGGFFFRLTRIKSSID